MSKKNLFRCLAAIKNQTLNLFVFLLAFGPATSTAEIVWSGDFNDRNFLNYHASSDPKAVFFHFVPAYGRPPQYGGQPSDHVGNGDLLDLVSSPTRGGRYAARFAIKSRAGGGVEPADCDPATDCGVRRTTLLMQKQFIEYYKAIPYGAERWLSVSFYLPADLDVSKSDSNSADWGVGVWGSKGSAMTSFPGWTGISIKPDSWLIEHRYFSEAMWRAGDSPNANWWLTTEYTKDFPSSSSWPQGLVDFPNEAASKAALANLNRGGWTDFVFHFKTDVSSRPISENQGFLDVYMRAGSGPWVHVLKIRPMANVVRDKSWVTTNPERIYDRGVGQYGPGGYTSQIGLYMPKGKVWEKRNNAVIYIDNHKVGDQNTTFEMMSHDGSSPSGLPDIKSQVAPLPPVLNSAE